MNGGSKNPAARVNVGDYVPQNGTITHWRSCLIEHLGIDAFDRLTRRQRQRLARQLAILLQWRKFALDSRIGWGDTERLREIYCAAVEDFWGERLKPRTLQRWAVAFSARGLKSLIDHRGVHHNRQRKELPADVDAEFRLLLGRGCSVPEARAELAGRELQFVLPGVRTLQAKYGRASRFARRHLRQCTGRARP